jgi:hypothetical protein
MNGKKMSDSLNSLLQRARRLHDRQAAKDLDATEVPRPGFSDRVLRRVHREREIQASPLFTLERAALWASALAACVTFSLWILPENPQPLALEAAAQSWMEIPGEDPIWGGL